MDCDWGVTARSMIQHMEKNYFAAAEFRTAAALFLSFGNTLLWLAGITGPFTGTRAGLAAALVKARVSPNAISVMGLGCAALALLTAYIRALGTSLGQPQDFCGPGAKPQRMFLLTVGGIAALAGFSALGWALWLIAVITLLTALRRSARLYRRLSKT